MTTDESGEGPGRRARPVVVELGPDAPPAPSPAEVPPVPDGAGFGGESASAPAPGRLEGAMRLSTRGGAKLAGWILAAAGSLAALAMGIAAWDFVIGLIARFPPLGWAAAAVAAVLALLLLVVAIRELAALGRLSRLERLRHLARTALERDDLAGAQSVTAQLEQLFRGRPALRWHMEALSSARSEELDAEGLLGRVEQQLLAPLDAAATDAVEAAARQVAVVTAVVPLAMVDVLAALAINLRMIRQVAEIYGGRAGTLGSWRLARAVLAHLAATGAVAAGDDMLGSLAGGNILARLGRRFGEGVVNGALTARVGLTAMELCRPLPFGRLRRPSVGATVRRALGGLFQAS